MSPYYFDLTPPKKAEGKRESFPQAPIKRKGKGKETSPGYMSNPLSPRARASRRVQVCSYREAGDRARQLCDILGLGASHRNYESSFRLWSKYCRYYPWYPISEKAFELASKQRQGEIRNAITAFQHWLTTNH